MTRTLFFWKAKLSLFILFIGLATTFDSAAASINKAAPENSPPVNCNALIMPGTVSGMQSSCSTSLDPTVISNVTSASSAEGPIQYLWMYRNQSTGYAWTSTGVTTDSLDPGVITETTEYVRCVGLVGCPTYPSETNVIRVSLYPPFNPSSVVTSNITCYGAMDGTATINVSGGGGPGSYYYQWDNGATTATITGLSAGSYSVTVTDTNGCTTSGSTTISEPTALSEVTTYTDVTCYDADNGTATITVSGGTTPYTYLWGDGQTTATATGLGAGTFTVTVTDSSGCTISSSATITEPTALTASSSTSPMTCDTQNDASITLTVSGGTAPYTYSWSNGATTANLSGLGSGTYTVTVTDANGCTTTETVIIAQSPINCCNLILPGTIGYNQSNCGPFTPNTLESLTPATSGYGANVEYLWLYRNASTSNNWISTGITTDTLAPGLVSMTTQYLRCARNQGCITYPGESNVITITIYPVPTPTLSTTDVSCYGGSDGSIVATISGGTMPFTYSWSDGQTTATASGLVAGTYTLTVTDSNGCSATASATVNEPTALTETTTSTDVSCYGGSDGTATISVSGGTAPYTYLWSDGQTTATATGLSAGTYTVTATDANGCTISGSATINEPTALAETTTSTDVSCNGGSDGTATVSVSGGTTPYSYLWSDGQTTATATGLSAGTYTVTVTDANGCTISGSATIDEPDALTEETVSTDVSCYGGADGTATISVTGGTTPYSYLWSDGQTTATATGLSAGTYTVTVTDANGCTISGTATVDEPTALAETTTSTDVSCHAGSDGTATISVSGGTAPYTYLWSDGQTTATATGLAAGTYTVTVTDANGCTISGSATINEPTPLAGVTTQKNITCYGANDGVAEITVSGGTMPYTYMWSNQETTSSVSGLAPGTYTVTVTDANGCYIMETVTITEPSALTEVTTSTNVSCHGGSDGTATITVSGGTTPYTYTWSDGQTTATATGLAAGTYTVTVIDSNACMITSTVTITEPTELDVNYENSDVSCYGFSDAVASAFASGGTAPYTYVWSDGQTGENATNLAAGTYTVTVTDANGCVDSATVTITQPDQLLGNISSTDVSCYGLSDGTASIMVLGGTTPYTYLWSDGQTTATATGLSAGLYTVDVTDYNGCTLTKTVTVGEPAALTETTTSTDVSCYAGSDGTATISVAGGTMPYTYLWSDGQTSATAVGLTAGTYSVTVTDANGCTISGSATINEPTALAETTTSTDVSCYGGNDGTATISVSGGTAPYSYLWSDGQTTATATGLVAGTYTVTVTDANGCTISGSATINEPTALAETTTSTDVSCYGGNDGTATISVSGGTMPYSYLWSDGQTTATATGLAAGTYTVTVTDANGCTISGSATINEPAALTEVTTSTNVSCYGGSDGTATITVSGGTMPYSYMWSNQETTASISGLSAGTYTVTVTDANGCTISQTVTITEPAALAETTTSTDVSCYGGNDGTATITVSGGTMPYSYMWSDGQTSATATGLAAGTYTVTITDANGCTISGSATINEPTALAETTTSTDVSCYGGNDGTATISVSGGTAPYSYLWSDGQTSATATGLVAGTYTVTVTDANGCTISGSATINEPTALAETTTSTDVSCYGGSDGTATITVSGGTAPYTYLWSDGQTSATATGLVAGTYTVTVTDANGCTISGSATINEPTALASVNSFIDVTCYGLSNGSATVTVSGGTAPYTYLWSDGQVGATATDLAAGTYTVTITDANGCTLSESVTVNQPTMLTSVTSTIDVSCNSYTDGSATITVSGGTMPYTYLWSDGQTTDTATGLAAGTYSVTATDANGCTTSETVVITEPGEFHAVTTYTDASCFGSCDGTSTIVLTGGVMPYTYLWSTGGTAATETGLCAGSYTVTATDANNCLATAATVISEPAEIAVTFSLNAGNSNILATGSNGQVPYTYLWSDGTTSSLLTGAVDGNTYSVTVTDANGCTKTDSIVYVDGVSQFTINVGPNPVTTTATMQISTPVSADVSVDIYDAQGHIVEHSYNGYLEAEVVLELVFDGHNIEPGLYFCRVTSSEGMSSSKKILLVK